MDLHEELKNFGMNKSQITIYLYLLEEGLSTPPQIAHGTGITRTNCYNILQSLRKDGLLEEHQKGKRKAYLVCDPEALIRNLQQKTETVERILPDLRGLYTLQKNKPKIKFYEGWDQVKEIYLQTLGAKEIYSIGSTKHLKEIDLTFFQKYIQLVKEKGIVVHDIISSTSQEHALMDTRDILKGYYDAKVLPKQYSNFQTDILIWGDNIALITLEEPIFGTVLTNKFLAETFRIIFKVMKDNL